MNVLNICSYQQNTHTLCFLPVIVVEMLALCDILEA